MKKSKTHILKSMNQRFLGSQHLPEGITEYTFIIDKMVEETIKDYTSKKPQEKKARIVYFKNAPEWALPWICNLTNSNLIYKSCKIERIEDYNNVELTLFIAKNVEQIRDIVSYDEENNEIKEKKIVKGEALRVRKAVLPKDEMEKRKVGQEMAQKVLIEAINDYIKLCKPEYSLKEFENTIGNKITNLSKDKCNEYIDRLNASIVKCT